MPLSLARISVLAAIASCCLLTPASHAVCTASFSAHSGPVYRNGFLSDFTIDAHGEGGSTNPYVDLLFAISPVDQPWNVMSQESASGIGPLNAQLSVGSCLAPGAYTWKAIAYCSPPEYPATEHTDWTTGTMTIEPRALPKITIKTLPPSYLSIKISYQFPENGGRLPTPFIDVTGEPHPLLLTSPSGEWTVPLNAGYHVLTAGMCSQNVLRIPFYLSNNLNECCPECSGCFGGPISAATGNMRYSDTDPLPSSDRQPLIRTYDSKRSAIGLLGKGWTSFFDESATATVESDGTTTVVVTTAEDNLRVFNGTSSFAQLWPKQPHAAALRSDGAGGYVFREYGSDVEHYFSSGSLRTLHDVSTGRDVLLQYTNGIITRVADSWGGWSWTVTRDPSFGTITSIAVDGTSTVWTYDYDVSRRLLSAKMNGVAWRTYTYSGGLITEVRDPAGVLIEGHTYGPAGSTSSTGINDDITNVEYGLSSGDPKRTITRVTHATGAQTSYYISNVGLRPRVDQIDGGCASCGGRNTILAYDDEGRIVREQDARGYVTSRSFDAPGRLLIETTALTPAGCNPETDPLQCRQAGTLATVALTPTTASVTRSYAYGAAPWYDRPTSITTDSVLNAGGSRDETFAYDTATGRVLAYTVSGWTGATAPPHLEQHATTTALYSGGEPAAFTPGGPFAAAWLSLPQPAGVTGQVDGPRTDVADVTTCVYYPVDSAVPATWRGRLAAVRNAAGHVTTYENYDVFGNARRIVDPNGIATERTYDALGRPLTTTVKGVAGCDTAADPLCPTDIMTTLAYTPATGPLSSRTDANGNVTTYAYDTRGRITLLTRGPSLTSLKERIEYSYDALTGRKSMEKYLANENGSWIEKRRESFSYDSLGQLIAQTHADTTSTAYTYDATGNVASLRDENHAAANTRYDYDPARRLSTEHHTLGTAEVTTSYSYDSAGNLTSVTDANGNQTAYVYDDFARMQSQTSPVSGTTTYAYDLAGNLVSSTDANGATTTRNYDALGRVSAASSVCSGWDAEEITWSYDDPTPGRNGIGRLTTMIDPSGATEYSYERRGLLRSENRVIANSSEMLYEYDAAGNRTRLDDLDYTYDFAGRPLTVTRRPDCELCPPVPIVTSASYLPFGPETELTYGGVRQVKLYDGRYRITENKLLGPAGSAIADYTYSSDANGNMTAISNIIDPSLNRAFAYDDLNRLTTANTGTGLWGNGAFSYDAMGNLLTSTIGSWTESFTYTGSTPRIATNVAQGRSTTVEYDAAGNETSASFWPRPGDSTFASANMSRSYSCRNLLAASSTQTVHAPAPCSEGHYCPPNPVVRLTFTNYLYDGRGVRVYGSNASFEGTEYLYTPELQLHRTRDSSDTTSEFIRFNGHPVAQIWSLHDGPLFTFTDHLGTPLLQVDADSNVVWRAEYEPYGRIYRLDSFETNQPLRFAGQDVVSPAAGGVEEHYNIFRWYRPGWGRYTQDDPMFAPQRAPRYFSYALNNPLSFTDPRGLFSVDPFCKGCKNPLRASDKSNLYQHVIEETTAFCQTKLSLIADVALRDCIKKSCQQGSVKCDVRESAYCADPATQAWTPMPLFDFIARIFPRRTAYLCANNVLNFNGDAGGAVIHEWAHGCGYDPDKALRGIPGSE